MGDLPPCGLSTEGPKQAELIPKVKGGGVKAGRRKDDCRGWMVVKRGGKNQCQPGGEKKGENRLFDQKIQSYRRTYGCPPKQRMSMQEWKQKRNPPQKYRPKKKKGSIWGQKITTKTSGSLKKWGERIQNRGQAHAIPEQKGRVEKKSRSPDSICRGRGGEEESFKPKGKCPPEWILSQVLKITWECRQIVNCRKSQTKGPRGNRVDTFNTQGQTRQKGVNRNYEAGSHGPRRD